MVQRTPNFNLPYVEGADTPVSYPTTSQELANTLDSALTVPRLSINNFALGSLPVGLSILKGGTASLKHGMLYDAATGNITLPKTGAYILQLVVGTNNQSISMQPYFTNTGGALLGGEGTVAGKATDTASVRNICSFTADFTAGAILRASVSMSTAGTLITAAAAVTYLGA